MCIPAAIIGVASAAIGAVGTISSYQAASAQAANENEMANRQYVLQAQAHQQQEAALNRQTMLNQEAASKAYVAEQQKIQAEYRKAALEADNLRVKSMQEASNIQSSGKTGRSMGVLAMDPDREYGRDLAVLGLNLGFARDDYYRSIDSIFDQATTANAEVASRRTPAPQKPMQVKGPSKLGLIAGLGGAALSGYQAYSSLKAPKGFTTPKAPSPFPSNNASLAFRIPSLI
jgi:hypothetical protein